MHDSQAEISGAEHANQKEEVEVQPLLLSYAIPIWLDFTSAPNCYT